jgi:hydrogenase nickel incorporation protein HypA/HybF
VHELGLCEAIVGAIEKRAGDRPVARVTVRVGRLHHVHADAFEQSFMMAAAGGVADAATATLVLLPVEHHCNSCGCDFVGDEITLACPDCEGVDVEVTGGDELTLESIEYKG